MFWLCGSMECIFGVATPKTSQNGLAIAQPNTQFPPTAGLQNAAACYMAQPLLFCSFYVGYGWCLGPGLEHELAHDIHVIA
jgi:hypothetical protein